MVVDMSFHSNNTFFPYKNKVEGGVMGSRDVVCLYNLPIKKDKIHLLSDFSETR